METDRIKGRYESRKDDARIKIHSHFSIYNNYISSEREKRYTQIIQNKFAEVFNLKLLEIGAGGGGNLKYFHDLGIPWQQIYANELLDDRIELLKKKEGDFHILPGDARMIDNNQKFDIVFQSTVFTSILDNDFKKQLAEKMMSMVSDKGLILWYDFIYDNPSNPDVKGVAKKEIQKLFHTVRKITFYPVTLAPPIGRRIGRLYPFFNTFKFLRTHVVAAIEL